MKIQKNPYPYLYPVPVVLVTCVDSFGKPNIITIAWTGIVCSDPPTLYISVRPSRYSHKLISETMEFAVNIPSSKQIKETDMCGVMSGSNADKFVLCQFTKDKACVIKPPLIRECPVNIECVVKEIKKLGVHDMFIGEIVKVHIDESVLNEKGMIDFNIADPVAYNDRQYWTLGRFIGNYAYTRRVESK